MFIEQDLERRLAIVLHQSFQQCPTIGAQLRLLEVFEGVSGREMVQEYLREKDKQLISSFTQELIAVRSMFLAKRNSPPNHVNLPPVVSRLTWVGALKKRIQVCYVDCLVALHFILFGGSVVAERIKATDSSSGG